MFKRHAQALRSQWSLILQNIIVLLLNRMNRLNVRDFSNVYSPKNKPLNNKLTKTLQIATLLASTLNSTLNSRYNPFSPKKDLSPRNTLTPRHRSSRSPASSSHNTSGNKALLSYIPKIDEARKIDKLKLSKDKVNEITDFLSIDEISKKAFSKRIQTNEPYIKFDRNPLSEITEKIQKPEVQKNALQKPEPQKRQKSKKITLLQAMKGLVNRDYQKKLKDQKKNEGGVNQFYMRAKRKEERQADEKKTRRQEPQVQQTTEKQAQKEESLSSPFAELDQIVNMKDEDYFMYKRNTEPFNLFQLKFNPNSVMFQSGREQLTNHKFSFDSMSSNVSVTINEEMIRSMSSYSRISANNSYSPAIPKQFQINERNFKFIDFDKISIEDVLQVANGQMRAEVLLKYINDEISVQRRLIEEMKANEEKNASKHKQMLKDNQEDKWTIYEANNFEKTNLRDLKRDQLSHIQIRQGELSIRHLKQMRVVLAQQLKLLETCIQDNKIHAGFKKKKDKIQMKQMEEDVDLNQRLIETERKIRMNKINKNQTEKIKIQEVTKTCRERRLLEKAQKQIMETTAEHQKRWVEFKFEKKKRLIL